jgi:hypothetical protein
MLLGIEGVYHIPLSSHNIQRYTFGVDMKEEFAFGRTHNLSFTLQVDLNTGLIMIMGLFFKFGPFKTRISQP